MKGMKQKRRQRASPNDSGSCPLLRRISWMSSVSMSLAMECWSVYHYGVLVSVPLSSDGQCTIMECWSVFYYGVMVSVPLWSVGQCDNVECLSVFRQYL